jgi:hypothetical protein
VLLVTVDSTLKVGFCSCFHFHKVIRYLKGAVDRVKVLLMIKVYQNFRMKPKNYIEDPSAVIDHLESVAVVFDCSIKYVIQSPTFSVSSKCRRQMYLSLYYCTESSS